jgi:hypothetical protein
MIWLSGMAWLDQQVSEQAGLESRVYADFLPNGGTLNEEPPKGGTPNGKHPLVSPQGLWHDGQSR